MDITVSRAVRLKRRFNLTYHVDAMEPWNEKVGFRGKRCLEVGGALPPDLVLDCYGATEWVAVDDTSAYVAEVYGSYGQRNIHSQQGRSQWQYFDMRIQDIAIQLFGLFDVVVSIAAFEHIRDLPAVLGVIRSVLRIDGFLCVFAGPIWSSFRGHHVLPSYFPEFPAERAAFLELVAPWQHLIQSRKAFRFWAVERFGQEFAETLAYSVYDSRRLNRLYFEEYLRCFALGGFEVRELFTWPTPPRVDKASYHRVAVAQPLFSRFDVDGFSAILRREEPTLREQVRGRATRRDAANTGSPDSR